MKERLADRYGQVCFRTDCSSFKRDNEIERAMGRPPYSSSDHACVIYASRYADAAVVRVRRKILNHRDSIIGIQEHLVNWLDGRDPLIVAIPAGMIIGP